MINISVAELLKIQGEWIEGKPFAEFIAEKKKISERHAYILIKKAWKNNEILRLPLPNRTVLYGLSEFGPPNFERSTEKKPSKEEDFRFYIEHGLITKEEIDVNAAAKTLLPIVPKEYVPYVKLIIINFQEKLKSLKESRKGF